MELIDNGTGIMSSNVSDHMGMDHGMHHAMTDDATVSPNMLDHSNMDQGGAMYHDDIPVGGHHGGQTVSRTVCKYGLRIGFNIKFELQSEEIVKLGATNVG